MMLGYTFASFCGLVGLVHSFPFSGAGGLLKPRADSQPFENIATGFYADPPLLTVHDRSGKVSWSFSRVDIKQQLPPVIQNSLDAGANDATDMKFMHGGKAVGAVYGDLVVVINYAPFQQNDKQILFAAPRRDTFLWNTHTLESLPDNKLAVATTGSHPWEGILVYDLNQPLSDNPVILQNITGQRDVHGMVWDEQLSILWCAGSDHAPDGSEGPAYGTIQGYPYNNQTKQLSFDPTLTYRMNHAWHQHEEWGAPDWYVSPHDVSAIPNERRLIVTCDRDVFVFDVDQRAFTLGGQAVVDQYLKGFVPTDSNRVGKNSKGQEEALPRSDIKSTSVAPDGSFIYVQSLWGEFQGNETNLVTNGQRTILEGGNLIYRSRWFEEIPGWPKP